MQFQTPIQRAGTSILEEIFQEVGQRCNHSNCQCSQCSSRRWTNNKEIIRELGWELTGEEEYELSKAFDKIKSLAKRALPAAKKAVNWVRVVLPLFNQHPDPGMLYDIERRRQMQERVEAAQPAAKDKVIQKPPDPETSMLQEIFMEAEKNSYSNSDFLELEYYEAVRTPNGVVKGRRLTEIQAQERIRRGEDVISDNKNEAKRIAKKAIRGKPIQDPGHKLPSGITGFPHAHVAGRRTPAHVFYPPKK